MNIVEAWCKETSADYEWNENNPSKGQCAVTALVIQDLLGGEIVRVMNVLWSGSVSHYYNIRPDGVALDLTRGQFKEWHPSLPSPVRREYLLSNENTLRRYKLLRERLGLSND